MSTISISFGADERRLAAAAAKRIRSVAICLFALASLLLMMFGVSWLWTSWPPTAVVVLSVEFSALAAIAWATKRAAASFGQLLPLASVYQLFSGPPR